MSWFNNPSGGEVGGGGEVGAVAGVRGGAGQTHRPGCFYGLSSGDRLLIDLAGVRFEPAVDLAGDGSFEAAFDLAAGLAFGGSAGGVSPGRCVVLKPR